MININIIIIDLILLVIINCRIKDSRKKAKQMEIEEARKENEEHVVDKVEAEMNAFKENRRHSDIARETKERIRRQKMKAKKVVEDEKQCWKSYFENIRFESNTILVDLRKTLR